MVRISAFEVGRIEPDVGKGRIGETPGLHVLGDCVERLIDPLHSVSAMRSTPRAEASYILRSVRRCLRHCLESSSSKAEITPR